MLAIYKGRAGARVLCTCKRGQGPLYLGHARGNAPCYKLRKPTTNPRVQGLVPAAARTGPLAAEAIQIPGDRTCPNPRRGLRVSPITRIAHDTGLLTLP